MPELPEVEKAREDLESWVGRRQILGVRIRDRRVLGGQSPGRVSATLSGATVRSLERRGKHLIWNLGRRGRAVAHLGMTGEFLIRDGDRPAPPGVRVVLQLTRGRRLLFVDPRRLGSFRLWDRETEAKLSRLGPEPLSATFTPRRLRELVTGARLPIKSFLMDQNRLAGLGNIYTAEVLYRAGIHPVRPADRLLDEEVALLHRSIRATLSKALQRERGRPTRYSGEHPSVNEFLVYGREGERCLDCGQSIERIVQAGRSTYFCPRCQPLRPRARTRPVVLPGARKEAHGTR